MHAAPRQRECESRVVAPSEPLARFVAMAIVLLPFNALPYGRTILGEIGYEGAFYPLLAGLLWWTMRAATRSPISLPRHPSARILLLFVIWIFISALLNVPSIIEAVTKGRTGIEKFLLQSLLVGFMVASGVFAFNILVRSGALLYRIRTWASFSFIACGLYSAIEIGKLLGVTAFADALFQIDAFIRDRDNLLAYAELGRLRSVSGEASWFAMYLAFVMPWLLSRLYTQSRPYWGHALVIAYALMLIALTWSRAAYGITLVQVLVFALGARYLVADGRRSARGNVVTISLVGLFAATATLTLVVFDQAVFAQRSLLDILLSLLDTDNLSNIGRIGSQVAAMRMAMENPWFGVGLGQYGFHLAGSAPGWALASAEMAGWMSSSVDAPWAPAHGLYSRIAAELGFVGLTLWLAIWISVIHGVTKRLRQRSGGREEQMLSLALLTSIVGVLLAGLNSDSLRFFGYWLVLAVAWAHIERAENPRPAV